MHKIVRTVCSFSSELNLSKIDAQQKAICSKLSKAGFTIQTQRVCIPQTSVAELELAFGKSNYLLSMGSLNRKNTLAQLEDFLETSLPIAFNLHLKDSIQAADIEFLFTIINKAPQKTFHFTYSFNNTKNSPYFPASDYGTDGFSIGLQPTNLALNCKSLEEWFTNMKNCWDEVIELFQDDASFLGIDSSVAPLFDKESSFIHFIQQLNPSFENACTSNIFTQVSNFIKTQNPKPIGLCGLMFPCLEDFELAHLYEQGNFNIERNIFLSLHSGLGIDTYPIGIDEKPERVLQILQLLQNLSNKYNKPLAARFVSDGEASIGQKTNYHNQYLKDVILRSL